MEGELNDIVTDFSDLEQVYKFNTKSIQPDQVNFVVSHGKCPDGYTSTTIARKYIGDDAVYVDAYHGSSDAKVDELIDSMKDQTVLICDFSFKPEVFQRMIDITNGNILVLDHHKTAVEYLADFDEKYYVMDMNHSGAFITYVYFYGFVNIPHGVLYIEDTDIWKKSLPYTEEFSVYQNTLEFNYESYGKILVNECIPDMLETGKVLLSQKTKIVGKYVKKSNIAFIKINENYYFVSLTVCENDYKSDIGNKCLKTYEFINFACVYSQKYPIGKTIFSLRSLDHRSDCSKIAKLHGGGGHRNASGCAVDSIVGCIPGRILSMNDAYTMIDNVYHVHNDQYSFLVINTPIMKTSFVRYLMQIIDDSDICEGQYILGDKLGDTKIIGAISYHVIDDRYYYKVKCDEYHMDNVCNIAENSPDKDIVIEYQKNGIISFDTNVSIDDYCSTFIL